MLIKHVLQNFFDSRLRIRFVFICLCQIVIGGLEELPNNSDYRFIHNILSESETRLVWDWFFRIFDSNSIILLFLLIGTF